VRADAQQYPANISFVAAKHTRTSLTVCSKPIARTNKGSLKVFKKPRSLPQLPQSNFHKPAVTMDTRTPLGEAHFKSVKMPSLPRITECPRSEPGRAKFLCERRDITIKQCSQWRKKVRFNNKTPSITPGKAPRLNKLYKERDELLIRADDIARLISRDCTWQEAVNFADHARSFLAKDESEAAKYLRLWRLPEG
jgi:hypothetical protein